MFSINVIFFKWRHRVCQTLCQCIVVVCLFNWYEIKFLIALGQCIEIELWFSKLLFLSFPDVSSIMRCVSSDSSYCDRRSSPADKQLNQLTRQPAHIRWSSCIQLANLAWISLFNLLWPAYSSLLMLFFMYCCSIIGLEIALLLWT